MTPIVSVLIPNYNHAPYLTQRIDAVLNQTFQNFEIIILDDCSTDNSRNIIEQYKHHPKIGRIIYNDTNSGSTFRQWNKGVNLCRAEIIWIAESDDFAHENYLSVVVPKMLADKNVGIAYCQSYKVNNKSEVTGTWKEDTDDCGYALFNADFRMVGKEYIKQFLINTNTIPNASGVIFRKKIYQLAGGADAGVKNCSDWLTWLKMLLVSDISYVAQPLNYFRYHDKSVIANAIANFDSGRYVEMHDRIMRISFHDYLQKNYSGESEISKFNYDYILKEYGDEGIFEIKNRRMVKGWNYIIKTLKFSKRNLLYIKLGIKQSFKQITGL